MKINTFLCSLIVGAATASCAGIADPAPAADNDGADDADVIAQKSCGTSAYNRARTDYRAALSRAALRKKGSICGEPDTATLRDIASLAGKAVASCPAFSARIRSNAEAVDLRAALQTSLALPALAGTLKVKNNWSGHESELEAALSKGVTLYGPAPGVFGNMSRLKFSSAGKGTLERLVIDERQGTTSWSATPINYRVGRARGELVEIVIADPTAVGREIPLLEVEVSADGAPSFSLEFGEETFTTYPSECES